MKFIEPVGAIGPANPYGHDYVDENAGAGIAGSYVPADAIEHPQIEILNAIVAEGLTPSTDLTQLSQAINAKIITTDVVKTVYGAGADFVDFNAASAWLSRRRIASSGSVTLQIGVGQFISATSQYLSHPDGLRISISGGRVGPRPTYATFSKTGNSLSARNADYATNLAMLRSIFNRELRFTNGAGLYVSGLFRSMTDILLTGDGSYVTGLNITGRVVNVAGVYAAGFGQYGIGVSQSGFAQLDTCGALGAQDLYGIGCDDGGTIVTIGDCVAVGCAQNGFMAVNGSRIRGFSGAISSGGHAGSGFKAQLGSLITLTPGIGRAELCAAAGLFASAKSSVSSGAFSSNFNGTSFYAEKDSFIGCEGSSGIGNSSAITAASGSFIFATGTAMDGAVSPAGNTIGNDRSYIKI